ncbi:MAG: hypothetical protein ACREQ3_09830, partial [Candidatus Binatia bacterium]
MSLYRSRRLAAERKLERTQENLSRVADLLREIERQLGSLRRQAKKAEQYRVLQEEFKTVDLTLLCQTYRILSEELATLDARLHETVHQEEQLSQEEQQVLAERAQTAAALAQEEMTLRAVEERCRTLEAVLRQDEQKKQFLLQQEQQAIARVSTAEQEEIELIEKRGLVESENARLSAQCAETHQFLLQDEALVHTREQESNVLQQTLVRHEMGAEEIKTQLVDLLTQEAQAQNALAYARRRAAEVEQRLQTLLREAERVKQAREETEQALATAQTQVANLRDRFLANQQQRTEQ